MELGWRTGAGAGAAAYDIGSCRVVDAGWDDGTEVESRSLSVSWRIGERYRSCWGSDEIDSSTTRRCPEPGAS